jgi:hypothetical protein
MYNLLKIIRETKYLSVIVLILISYTEIKTFLVTIDYFINYNYIAKNLCENKDKPKLKCNGKCHLKKELKKVEESKQTNKKIPVTETKREPFVITHTNLNLSFISTLKPNFPEYTILSIKEVYLNLQTPPPKFFV